MELPDVPLFRGLTADEAEAAVTALRMRRRAFAKGETLLEAGQRAPALGVVLAGRVHMEHLDVWGSKTLLGQAGPGDLFAETYAKTIRGRITAYFSMLARQNGSLRFTLPFDRQQLADHLGVDRSALSNALSQMQKEGLLVIDKREVELKQVEEM